MLLTFPGVEHLNIPGKSLVVNGLPPVSRSWGKLTLPGGGKLGVYQPRHERPEPMVAK
jgi:hypothetical protein